MARRRRRAVQLGRPRPGTPEGSPEAIRAASRALANERLAAAPRCPRCSSPIPPNVNGRGRPRVWCSQVCRRAAYEERRAAAAGAIAKELVVERVQPSWDETIERVVQSPKACKQVLRVIRQRLEAGELLRSPWNQVSGELWELSDAWVRRR